MTIRELLKLLVAQPDLDAEIILQKDAEGNGYSPLVGGERGYYVADSTYSGEVYTPEDLEDGENVPPDWKPVLVLWPVN